MVFEFINGADREAEEMYYDAISGERLESELIKEARKVEMELLKNKWVYEKVPMDEWWKNTVEGPVGVKWGDANKADKDNPDYICRLGANEMKRGKRVCW